MKAEIALVERVNEWIKLKVLLIPETRVENAFLEDAIKKDPEIDLSVQHLVENVAK